MKTSDETGSPNREDSETSSKNKVSLRAYLIIGLWVAIGVAFVALIWAEALGLLS